MRSEVRCLRASNQSDARARPKLYDVTFGLRLSNGTQRCFCTKNAVSFAKCTDCNASGHTDTIMNRMPRTTPRAPEGLLGSPNTPSYRCCCRSLVRHESGLTQMPKWTAPAWATLNATYDGSGCQLASCIDVATASQGSTLERTEARYHSPHASGACV
jgi:hypothetical protein